MPQLNTSSVVALARDLERELAEHPVVLAEALVELVEQLAASADETREGISDDVMIQRGLAQWDRDRARLREQLRRVFEPSISGENGEPPEDIVQDDVVEPIIRGLWPAWLPTLPQYVGGVPPLDPLLPRVTERRVDGQRRFVTLPVAANVASLWTQVHVAAGLDREQGMARFRSVLTATAAAFERPAPDGNPGEFNVWETARQWAANAGELVDRGGSAFFGSSIFGTALLVGGGIALGGLVLHFVFRR